LNYHGLTLSDFDLFDLRWQLERFVQAHTVRIVGGFQ